MTREETIQYLDRFNIAPFTELRTWDDKRLSDAVAFIKQQISIKKDDK